MDGITVEPTGVTAIDGTHEVRVTTQPHHNGPPGILQGGLAAGVQLAAAQAVDRFGAPATMVDARLRRPTPVGEEVTVTVRRVSGATYETATVGPDGPRVTATVELAGQDPAPQVADLLELATVDLPTPQPQQFAPTCWVCGGDNPHGLHLLPAWREDGSIVEGFIPPDGLADARGNLDLLGVAAVLDCPTVWASWDHAQAHGFEVVLLAGFHLRLFRDAPIGEPLRIVSRMDSGDGPKMRARAALVDEDRVVYAMASAFQYGATALPTP